MNKHIKIAFFIHCKEKLLKFKKKLLREDKLTVR
jgi:hypothetical protein